MCFHMVAEKNIFSELYKSDKSTSLKGYILITEILYTLEYFTLPNAYQFCFISKSLSCIVVKWVETLTYGACGCEFESPMGQLAADKLSLCPPSRK